MHYHETPKCTQRVSADRAKRPWFAAAPAVVTLLLSLTMLPYVVQHVVSRSHPKQRHLLRHVVYHCSSAAVTLEPANGVVLVSSMFVLCLFVVKADGTVGDPVRGTHERC